MVPRKNDSFFSLSFLFFLSFFFFFSFFTLFLLFLLPRGNLKIFLALGTHGMRTRREKVHVRPLLPFEIFTRPDKINDWKLTRNYAYVTRGEERASIASTPHLWLIRNEYMFAYLFVLFPGICISCTEEKPVLLHWSLHRTTLYDPLFCHVSIILVFSARSW